MGKEITIGGERLGNGKKMKAYMHNYERSTHDLSYVWRSTMSAGTLVPFMSEVALPGDTFDIDLNVDIMTHPTIGPLFGSYKVQLDVFQIPIRLYQAKLHMNMLNIGRDMSKIKLPLVQIYGNNLDLEYDLDNQQINPSSIFSYLGIRGLGYKENQEKISVIREFNAIPWLGYWDIYKNYYANKQEEIGAVIHKQVSGNPIAAITNCIYVNTFDGDISIPIAFPVWTKVNPRPSGSTLLINVAMVPEGFDPESDLILTMRTLNANQSQSDIPLGLLYDNINYDKNTGIITCSGLWGWQPNEAFEIYQISQKPSFIPSEDTKPQVRTFPLENIDKMRENILKWFSDEAYVLNVLNTEAPYYMALDQESNISTGTVNYSCTYTQEGLGLKTYQSDLFNNWISTEWIDGPDGISEVTAIDTSEGSFTLDELNLSQKIYNMLNRIALSGGTYDDWLDAVYTHDRQRSSENPIYLGGAIRELIFQEVVSNAASNQMDGNIQPLGTLAGKGRLSGDKKGGKIIAKIDEPSYIMGIISLTPRIDYSQGNKWDTNLKSLNDFHKPALDEIGFQDLITDQMAFFETMDKFVGFETVFRSAGKQPAWLNYMTNVNVCKGNFAIADNQMFMTLNRKYDYEYIAEDKTIRIADLTTYIDPSKFNSVFAQTSLDAQNFWAQIGVNITARRKMSAKIIPNL